jgi:hypothetical protein
MHTHTNQIMGRQTYAQTYLHYVARLYDMFVRPACCVHLQICRLANSGRCRMCEFGFLDWWWCCFGRSALPMCRQCKVERGTAVAICVVVTCVMLVPLACATRDCKCLTLNVHCVRLPRCINQLEFERRVFKVV